MSTMHPIDAASAYRKAVILPVTLAEIAWDAAAKRAHDDGVRRYQQDAEADAWFDEQVPGLSFPELPKELSAVSPVTALLLHSLRELDDAGSTFAHRVEVWHREQRSSQARLDPPPPVTGSDENLEPFGGTVEDRFTPAGLLQLLTEYSHGYHNPVGSEEWNEEVFNCIELDSYAIEDLQNLRQRVEDAIARKAGGHR